jgi:hypothetical protein
MNMDSRWMLAAGTPGAPVAGPPGPRSGNSVLEIRSKPLSAGANSRKRRRPRLGPAVPAASGLLPHIAGLAGIRASTGSKRRRAHRWVCPTWAPEHAAADWRSLSWRTWPGVKSRLYRSTPAGERCRCMPRPERPRGSDRSETRTALHQAERRPIPSPDRAAQPPERRRHRIRTAPPNPTHRRRDQQRNRHRSLPNLRH